MRYTLRQLEVFLETAREENVSRAADALAMSQSAASGALRELEQQGEIGKAADTHYAFMGATSPGKMEDRAREAGRSMLALGVNTVVLAPV